MSVHYLVGVSGQYMNTEGKLSKYCVKDFKLPELEAALSVVKNKLLDKRLMADYPDFSAVYTHFLDFTEEVSDTKGVKPKEVVVSRKNISFMNKKQLISYLTMNALPIDIQWYEKAHELREAIKLCEENQEKFEAREMELLKERKQNKILKELNG